MNRQDQSKHYVGDYEFNECGVCLNPDKAFEGKAGKNVFARIDVAQVRVDPPKWSYGHRYDMGDRGGSCGVWDDGEEMFATREEALLDGLAYLHKRFTSENDVPKSMIGHINKLTDLIAITIFAIAATPPKDSAENKGQLALVFPE